MFGTISGGTALRQETLWKSLLKGREDWLPRHDEWLGPQLNAALSALPRREKQVLYLRYILGLSRPEAAEILGVAQSRVSHAELRARRKIKTHLSQSTVE